MTRAIALTAVTLALLGAVRAVGAPRPADLAAIDRQFVCPEDLGSDQARTEALRRFMEGASRAAPDMTISELLAYRKTLLTRRGCARTLKSLEAVDAAAARGDVEHQAWFPLSLGVQAVSLSISTDHLKRFADPRRPDEPAVETYEKIAFTTPQVTNVTHVTYDEVISHNVYYCRAGAYALVENDYFLAGKAVLKDPSPVQARFGATKLYQADPIPPNSLNNLAAIWACGTVQAGLAANRGQGGGA